MTCRKASSWGVDAVIGEDAATRVGNTVILAVLLVVQGLVLKDREYEERGHL